MFIHNQDEFGTNCVVGKHTKISVKISVEFRISVDIQKVKYRPIISVDRYIGRSLICSQNKLKSIFSICSIIYENISVLCFSDIAKTINLYVVTTHFKKCDYTSRFFTVYMLQHMQKHYQCCWFEIVVTPKVRNRCCS